MSAQKFLPRLMMIIFLLAGLACSVVSGIGEQFTDTKNTAESVATDINQGINLVGTAKAAITQIGGNNLLLTAQAAATQLGDTGLLQTAQAVATEVGPNLLNTLESAATEHPGLVETAKAVATEQGPGLIETAQALATQVADGSGQAPADIPMVEGEKDVTFASSGIVTYFTPLDFNAVKDFYKEQMPANGWTKVEDGSVEVEDTAVLNYDKTDRRATVTLSVNPLDKKTIVMITIIEK